MASWTAVPNGDVSLGSWVKETGSGTPIFGEIDEGIASADNTGIKVASSSTSVGAATFTLSDSPSTLYNYPITPAGTWESVSGGSWRAIAYGNGYWVVVGDSGVLLYAKSPAGPWTSNTQGTETFYAVAYAAGYWVAVGANGALRYRATDPTGTWTSNNQGTTAFFSVAYGNGYWVAVGNSGGLYYKSTNPTGAWTSNTQGTETFYDVEYAAGYWVAVGTNGALRYRATDPTGTWTSNNQGTETLRSVTYGNGYWVAIISVGNPRLYYNKTDPTGSWTLNQVGASGSPALSAITYGNDYWVACGRGEGLYYRASNPIELWVSNQQTGSSTHESLVYAANYWVAVSISGFLRYKGISTPITGVTLQIRARQTGLVNDTSALVTAQVYKSDGTTAVGSAVSLDVTAQTSYANTSATALTTSAFSALSKDDLDGLLISFTASKNSVQSPDAMTYYVDAAELVVTYTILDQVGYPQVVTIAPK